jgi:hypothetical protein
MSPADMCNAAFELFGGVFVLNHCRALFEAKIVKGISIVSTVFFTAWGVWNLYYYPSLGQWASFAGGVFICLANLLWVAIRVGAIPAQSDAWCAPPTAIPMGW